MRIHLRSKTKFHLKTISPQGSLKQVFFRRASTATAGIPLYFKGAVRSCVGKDRFKPLWVRLSFGIIEEGEKKMNNQKQPTLTFSIQDTKELEMKKALEEVYSALIEKGYNPINQIVGYILSEDPKYITNYKNARGIIRKIDRDDLLNALVKNYLGV